MKISIYDAGDKKKFSVPLPSCILFSRPMSSLICRIVMKKGTSDKIEIKGGGMAGIVIEKNCDTEKLINRAFRVMRKFRRRHKKFQLLEISSADGDSVEIRI